MIVTLLIVLGVFAALTALTFGVVMWRARAYRSEPSPRSRHDDRVAVLEGGSGRGWD